MAITTKEGRSLVLLARSTLDSFVSHRSVEKLEFVSPLLKEKRGVFVTLKAVGSGGESLRGCIGFPFPVRPLGDGIREATVAAASEDPRFPPVESEELGRILLELSVLTPPETVEVRERTELPKRIRVGKDGLIVSTGYQSGLLLPQVATEYRMDAETFLSATCEKAGLPPDSWLEPAVTVQRFQAEIFAETEPGGEVKAFTT